MFDLNGKVAVITGSSKGIGEAMSRGLAEFGAHVVLSSRSQEAVDQVAEKFKVDGLKASAVACHVAKDEDRKKLINTVMEQHGRVDVLINNAGTNPYLGPIHSMPENLYQKTMNVNTNAAISLSNLVYPIMKNQKGGSIIHISSIEGMHPSKMMSAYNMSKAALLMLGKNQAIEWAKYNIRVNMICPGFVTTKLSSGLLENKEIYEGLVNNVALKRPGSPEEMAGLAVFLASDASSYMTGSTIVNDGGLLHAPLF